MSQSPIDPGLYLVSTPIGSARDITLRALDILTVADVIAAEDTRNTRKLLEIHGIALRGRPLISYHDHNGQRQRPKLIAALNAGKVVAFVSDAGTPLVADPGFSLAKEAIAHELPLFAAPGASALLAAICVAGLPSDQFFFAGFIPTKSGARRRFLQNLKPVPATLVFYETGRRLAASLEEIAEVFGKDRHGAVCRELTKKFETIERGTVEELITRAGDTMTLKGEIVLVIGPAQNAVISVGSLADEIDLLLEEKTVKTIATELAEKYGLARKEIYQFALGRKN